MRISIEQMKDYAHSIKGKILTHTEALEAVAKIQGYPNWQEAVDSQGTFTRVVADVEASSCIHSYQAVICLSKVRSKQLFDIQLKLRLGEAMEGPMQVVFPDSSTLFLDTERDYGKNYVDTDLGKFLKEERNLKLPKDEFEKELLRHVDYIYTSNEVIVTPYFYIWRFIEEGIKIGEFYPGQSDDLYTEALQAGDLYIV